MTSAVSVLPMVSTMGSGLCHSWSPRTPTPFEKAASAGLCRRVLRRLRRDPPPPSECAYALSAAATAGHLPVVESLIPWVGPEHHHAAFLHASARGHDTIVARLLPLANPRSQDSWALTMASQMGHLGVVHRLLPVSDPCGNQGEAVRLAACAGHEAVVAVLWPYVLPQVDIVVGAALGHHQWDALEFFGARLPPSCLPRILAADAARRTPGLYARWFQGELMTSLPPAVADASLPSRL